MTITENGRKNGLKNRRKQIWKEWIMKLVDLWETSSRIVKSGKGKKKVRMEGDKNSL